MGRKIGALLAMVLLGGLLAPGWSGRGATAASTPRYEIVDLGAIEVPLEPDMAGDRQCEAGRYGLVTGINDAGVAVGHAPRSVAWTVPFSHTGAVRTTLQPGPGGGMATDINAGGVIVGAVALKTGKGRCAPGERWQPAVWTNGVLELVDLPNARSAWFTAINDDGVAVGTSDVGAFVWRDGDVTELPVDAGETGATATAINADGVIAGTVVDAEGRTVPVIWEEGVKRVIGPGDDTLQVFDIADDGTVIGAALIVGSIWAPFVDRDGVSTGLDIENGTYRGGMPLAIAADGTIVGAAYKDQSPVAVAWMDGEIVDLNTLVAAGSGWELASAVDINASGMIAGWGARDGAAHGFMLIPAEGAATPEPAR